MEEDHHRHGQQSGQPLVEDRRVQQGGEVGLHRQDVALETVDNEHGDDGGGKDPAQVQHQLGGVVSPVKEQEGEGAG